MSEPSSRPPSPGGLIELSTGIIKQLAELSPDIASDTLRGRFEDLFRDFESRALRAGIPAADVTSAKYALAALVDETILLSDHPAKDEWLGKPLQMQYFDEFSAGEEFYNRLEQLRLQRSPGMVEVLEVYHLCLAFGFKGKYGNAKGEERLKVISESLANDISQARDLKKTAPLSAQGEVQDALPMASPAFSFLSHAPLWAVPMIMLIMTVVVYVAYSVLTDAALAGFSSSLHAAGAP